MIMCGLQQIEVVYCGRDSAVKKKGSVISCACFDTDTLVQIIFAPQTDPNVGAS